MTVKAQGATTPAGAAARGLASLARRRPQRPAFRRLALSLMLGLASGLGAVTASLAATGPASPGAADSACAGLVSLKLPSAKVLRATAVARGALVTQSIVAPADICRVEALVTTSPSSDLMVEVWLPRPASWNGKFLGTGNGAAAGQIIFPALSDGVARGYATANTDLGTRAPPGPQTFRALIGKTEMQTDFSHRGTHLMTVVGKAVAAAYYVRQPAISLFSGCSGGGNSGLGELQRYPNDYDGIAVGSPPIAGSYLSLLQGLSYADSRRDPASIIGREKLPAIARAVLAECDGLDGLKDGLIADPRRCLFDPAVLQCAGADSPRCLTAPQVAALRKIYAGLRGPRGEQLYAGFSPGAENTPGALARIAGLNAGSAINPETPGGLVWQLGAQWKAEDWLTFDFEHQLVPFGEKARLSEHASPDLRAFAQHGGKVIFWGGWHDALQNPAQLIVYFEQVQAASGGPKATDAFARLFLFPGMEHCGGGIGPNNIVQRGAQKSPPGLGDPDHDLIAALDRWVTKKQAPDRLIATKYEDDDTARPAVRSRPACPYPAEARWTGTGSILKAESYVCARPQD